MNNWIEIALNLVHKRGVFKQLAVLFPLLILANTTTFAFDGGGLDDVSVKVSPKSTRHARPIRLPPGHNIIMEYKLSRGDITQEEIDAKSEERMSHRREFRALRKSGDRAALRARSSEMRVLRNSHRQEMEEYLQANPELRDTLEQKRGEHQSDRKFGRGMKTGNVRRSEIIMDYKLSHGDITQEEIDAKKAERNNLRSELKALMASGDRAAMRARREEMHERRAQQRNEEQAYIEANEELRDALEKSRDEHMVKRAEAREVKGEK